MVLGQSDFTSGSAPTGITSTSLAMPYSVAISSTQLFISDRTDLRLLGYNALPTANGAAAAFAVGQADLTSSVGGVAANQFNGNMGVFIAGTKLLLADEVNHHLER